MRGTPSHVPVYAYLIGIIPAYAGNTGVPIVSSHTALGSSPHMRGTLHRLVNRRQSLGIIPAYAGNTSVLPTVNSIVKGSSPHMRGTLGCIMHLLKQFGIIPAYAGNTTPRPTRGSRPRDHPRICGEHPSVLAYSSRLEGSSPHMRGTLPSFYHVHDLAGIIPAYAGNTWIVGGFGGFNGDHPRICGEHPPDNYHPPPARRDHPRICGEHLVYTSVAFALPGSSPHMRGTPTTALFHYRATGIIPAYAGNTCVIRVAGASRWDHPRICGEHRKWLIQDTPSGGSSPHMRGTLTTSTPKFALRGIIPAYAGNT